MATTAKAKKAEKPKIVPTKKPEIEIIQKPQVAIDYLRDLARQDKPVSFDYETNGINPFRLADPHLLTVAFATSLGAGTCIPLDHPQSPLLGDTRVKQALAEFFKSEVPKSAHNGKFEIMWSRKILGVEPRNLDFDTMLAHYLLDENVKKYGHDLGVLTIRYLREYGGYDNDIDQSKLSLYPLAQVGEYNAIDSCVTSGLQGLFEPEIEKQGLWLPMEIMMEAVYALSEIEFNGNPLDMSFIREMTYIFKNRMEDVDRRITQNKITQKAAFLATNLSFASGKIKMSYQEALDLYNEFKDVDPFELTPEERRIFKSIKNTILNKPAPVFNIKSTPQLRTLLYHEECLNLPVIAYVKKRKNSHDNDVDYTDGEPESIDDSVDLAVDTSNDEEKKQERSPSCDSDVLKILANAHELPALMTEGRVISGIMSAFINPINGENTSEPWVCQDGCVRSSYVMHFVKTGRLSSTAPNMQNLPRIDTVKKYKLPNVKQCIVSRFEGGKIVQADYSQLELRVLGMYSKDPGLINAYQNGEDIHARTASVIFRVPIDKVVKSQRQVGKTVNFGLVFEKSPHTLALELIQESPDFVIEVLEREGKLEVRRDEKNTIQEFRFKVKVPVAGGKDWQPKARMSFLGLHPRMKWVKNLIEVEAERVMADYFKGFPRVKDYVEEAHAEALKYGFVRSFSGRRRRFPKLMGNIADLDSWELDRMLRQANNFKVQSFASDCTMTAIKAINWTLREFGLRSKLINTVHDSIVLDCPPEEIKQVCAILHECMETYVHDFFTERLGPNVMVVPLVAEIEIGDNYGEGMKEEDYFKSLEGAA